MNSRRLLLYVSLSWLLLAATSMSQLAKPLLADDLQEQLRARLTLHAPFDTVGDASFAVGDRQIYTAQDISRKEVAAGLPSHVKIEPATGRWGGSLLFTDVSNQVIFFRGQHNLPYDAKGFDATVSFWMRLSPEEDLKPGYTDPLQITDKEWNNSAIFLDFSKDEVPRQFRLGVFSDYKFWNPQDTPWDNIPDAQRPMVIVHRHPFHRDRWTHVAFRLQDMNRSTDATYELFLDGVSQGKKVARQQFTWTLDRVAIMLGIQYLGRLDDFAIFQGALTNEQIDQLRQLPGGVAALGKER